MPYYDFKCDKCELTFEKSYKMTDTKTPVCPICHSSKTQRILSKVSIIKGEPNPTVPKDVDMAVGSWAEKRWLQYEERKKEKEKVKKEFGTEKLARDTQGNYTPLAVMKDGVIVNEQEAISLRKEMANDFNTIVGDPETKEIVNKITPLK
jgi:putative FmdB family regulatory protein